jgi:hypothetical protein
MAAPAFALLWTDQSEAAPFRAGHSPGATVFAGSCCSPASLVGCLSIINERQDRTGVRFFIPLRPIPTAGAASATKPGGRHATTRPGWRSRAKPVFRASLEETDMKFKTLAAVTIGPLIALGLLLVRRLRSI